MAGQAEKKLKQRAERGGTLYFYLAGSVSVIYFLYMILFKAYAGGLGVWDVGSWAFFTAVTFVTYGAIVDSLKLGVEAE